MSERPLDTSTQVLGVMALELTPGMHAERGALSQADAGRLAELLGRDLGVLVPGVRELDLCLAAAHFDPAEVLRPGWPLHRRLDALRLRAPQAGQGPRIVAFGADANGQIPQPFRADRDLLGGTLRVLPFLLVGEAQAATAVGRKFEELLLDLGMVDAKTALFAQGAFGARIEHARYLTVHDLAAMMALQYRNAGLEAFWPILETALLAPDHEAWLDAPPEPLVHYIEREARIALFDPHSWQARYAPAEQDCVRLERGFGLFEARQRQFAAVLRAHDVPVTFAHCASSEDAVQALN